MSAQLCSECGARPMHVRGVCTTCYERHRRAGKLDELAPSRRGHDNAYVMSEWLWLSSFGVTLERAAAQLGITPKALQRAIERHSHNERVAS